MPKAALIFPLCIFSSIGVAVAQTAAPGGSNIALSEYPGPSCTKPQAPVQPQLPKDPKDANLEAAYNIAVQRYNLEIQRFNKAIAVYNADLKEFNSCMQAYVDNGNADMARIKQRLDQAVAAANAR